MSDLVILEPHNEPQLGDELTSLSVNYLWRRRIVEALSLYFEPLLTRASVDDDVQTTLNNFNALLVDLYDTEGFMENNPRIRTWGQGVTGVPGGTEYLCNWQPIIGDAQRYEVGGVFALQSNDTRFVNISAGDIWVHFSTANRIVSAALSNKTLSVYHSALGRIARATVGANTNASELLCAGDIVLAPGEYLDVRVLSNSLYDWDAQSVVFRSYFSMHRIG